MSCCTPVNFRPVEEYTPSKKEVKDIIYNIFATILCSGIIRGPVVALFSAAGCVMSVCCYKVIDYFGDGLLKGKISQENLDLIKSVVKVVGLILTGVVSFLLFNFPAGPMGVSLLLAAALGAHLKALAPLDLF